MSAADDDLGAELRRLFLEELDDGLALLEAALPKLELSPDRETVDELFRTAHSLKGAAHAAGAGEAVAVCARLEDLLATLRSGGADIPESVTRSIAAEVGALARLADRSGSPGPAAPAPAAGSGRRDAEAPAGPAPAAAERVRVDVARLSALVGHAAQLRVTANRLAELGDRARAARDQLTAGGPAGGADDRARPGERHDAVAVLDRLVLEAAVVHRELSSSASRLAATAQELRLQPFAESCAGLERAARDVADAAGKSVRVVLEGGDVEMDRDVAAGLRDPLLHLVRNAVDHGIEMPPRRVAAGKPPEGTVRVTATSLASEIHVTVADDGAGVDAEGLRRAAAGAGMADAGWYEAAFAAGVSTAPAVTDVSGRGVGLDAVRARVEGLGGSVHMASEPGGGTRVELRVPVTLSTMPVLVVQAGSAPLALPVAAVERVELVGPSGAGPAGAAVHLAAVLGLRQSAPAGGSATVVHLAGDAGTVRVDAVLEQTEVTVHQVPARAAGATGVLGVTVRADGCPVLVVNPATLARASVAAGGERGGEAGSPPETARRVLLAEDSPTTRALERTILARAGYDVVVAKDGLEAWAALDEHDIDLVVSDVDMPGLDGIELCRRMRASPRHQRTPVVLVTSLSDEIDRRRGLEAGADAYVVKSAFDEATLLAALERLL